MNTLPKLAPPFPGYRGQEFYTSPSVTVFHFGLTPNPTGEAESWALLHEGERERAWRFRYAQHRRQFILCRGALRSLLCHQLDCRNDDLVIRTLEHGKPFALVEGSVAPISFNVSHSGNHGLIALASKGRLGVDVEERSHRRDLDAISETVFSPGEQAELASAGSPDRVHLFYKLWTIKEAFIKALGTGLSLSPSQFEVPLVMRNGGFHSAFEFPEEPGVQWRLEDLGNDCFAAAIAHEVDAEGLWEESRTDGS